MVVPALRRPGSWRSSDDASPHSTQRSRWVALVAIVGMGFLMLQMLPIMHIPHNNPPQIWIPRKQHNEANAVRVFLCSDEKDLRPIAVVINSTLCNTRHPEHIYFHIVTAESHHSIWFSKLKALFPESNIEILSDKFNIWDIQKHIKLRTDSKTRGELASPYNFIPFYISQFFPWLERFVYLDTDVVVKGEIEELYSLDLGEYAAAAVEDCSQKFQTYFNFKALEEIRIRHFGSLPWIPEAPFDPNTCVFNRGVLVIDRKKWIEQNMTQAIEWWMEQYDHAETTLYRYGLSQPPFLLAMYEKYVKLETNWNTRGLGRNKMSELEREFMQKLYSKKPGRRPFLSPDAHNSKLLHFNGEFKPWKRNRTLKSNEKPVSLCGFKREDCALQWWKYLSPAGEASLLET